MDAATIFWTLLLFGGTIVIVVWLLSWAWRTDRRKRQAAEPDAEA